MRSANCSPISHPVLPPTHQHHMWDAWDMAAEICLSQLPSLVDDPNAEFQSSPFFTEQLTAFEIWLDHGSEHKKPPEQLPIVLQVLLSQCHRFRALVLLGRFLDMGPWAVNLALSVGIFPYVLKLLQTTTPELRQILVFIWTKILALDKSCQVDLVKDGGHAYFIRFLDSAEAFPEQRAMSAFVLAVIVDKHKHGLEACIGSGLIHVCLKHLRSSISSELPTEPLFLQWLCLCLGKLWEENSEAQGISMHEDSHVVCSSLLSEPLPEVRASAAFALGTLLDTAPDKSRVEDGYCDDDDEKIRAPEAAIVKSLLNVASDGSPLVRTEVVVALSHFASSHSKHLKAAADACLKPQTASPLTSVPSLVHLKSASSGCIYPNSFVHGSTTTIPPMESILNVASDMQPMSLNGRPMPSSSPITNYGLRTGSPLSDDSSKHSDSGSFNYVARNGATNHPISRPLDNALYSQFVLTMFTFAKDPSPCIASLGRRVLSKIGIEQTIAKPLKSRTYEPIVAPKPSLASLVRSNSLFDTTGGHLPLSFRTPPASPPKSSILSGIRRVYSYDFGASLLNPLGSGSTDRFLGSSLSAKLSEGSLRSQSVIYNWSCGHFSRPLLAAKDNSLSEREEKEKLVLDHIVKCQRSSVTHLSDPIARWDTRFETGAKTAVLQPFSPIVVASDESEQIRVWNYEEDSLLNCFDNHDYPNKGISKLCLVNELDDSLLLVASCDGSVRIWKDYTSRGKQRLVSGFFSIQGQKTRMRSLNTVVDWQQQSGFLYASGELPSVMVWDLQREQLLNSIPWSSEYGISALSASQVHGGQFVAGFLDGTVRLYDIRAHEQLVSVSRPHTQKAEKVVGIGFQPGLDPFKIVSASQAGDIQFLDIRNQKEAYLTIDAHRGSLTALAIHRHASVIASGSAKQLIKVFSLEGEQLGIIRYYPTFMGQKIGSISCLAFHPYQVLLAASSADACVSIYVDDGPNSR